MMALGMGAEGLERTMEAEAGEVSGLPERMGARRESDCLPDRLGARRESDCLPEKLGVRQKGNSLFDAPEATKKDIQSEDLEKLEAMLNTAEGIRKLMEAHPEKIELWEKALEALETLNHPDATDAEKRSAIGKLSALKGQLLEVAVKDVLAERGLFVEPKQRTVEGQDGGTRPDVIAANSTDQPITVFGIAVSPGETISVECKCGGKGYLRDQLCNHIPNQLSGQIGHRALLTTGDIHKVDRNLVRDVCEKYGAKLVTLGVRISDIEKAIKEVSAA